MTFVKNNDRVIDSVTAAFNTENGVDRWHLHSPATTRQRPWSTLYFFTLSTGQQDRELVVKIPCCPGQTLPDLSWQDPDLLKRGRCEYDSLKMIEAYFSELDQPRLHFIKTYCYIREINGVVMAKIPGQPLHHRYFTSSLLLSRHFRHEAENCMVEAGRWLSFFHRMPTDTNADQTCHTVTDLSYAISSHIRKLSEFGIAVDWLTKQLKHIDCPVLPQPPLLVWRHGDYHMGNVLELPDKGILGFDTTLTCLDTPYYDLAKFLAMLMANRKCILTAGRLSQSMPVVSLKKAFLSGYFNGKSYDAALLHWYEGFFLLQRWIEEKENLEQYRVTPVSKLGDWLVNITFQHLLKQWLIEGRHIGLFSFSNL